MKSIQQINNASEKDYAAEIYPSGILPRSLENVYAIPLLFLYKMIIQSRYLNAVLVLVIISVEENLQLELIHFFLNFLFID